MFGNKNDLIVISYSNGEAFILANRKNDIERITDMKNIFKILNEYENPIIKKYNTLTKEEQYEIDKNIDCYLNLTRQKTN